MKIAFRLNKIGKTANSISEKIKGVVFMQLSEKERNMLEELKTHERLCIEKYGRHSQCANDEQLKSLFAGLSEEERTHLNTLEQLGNGIVPPTAGSEKPMPEFTAKYKAVLCPEKAADTYLCTDVLSGEKHVSRLYDTAIFEFRDENMRKVLNHIQKEEQNHGKMIYDYMSTNGMY